MAVILAEDHNKRAVYLFLQVESRMGPIWEIMVCTTIMSPMDHTFPEHRRDFFHDAQFV